MLLPAKREALRICKRSYPIMENLMAPRTPVLFFSGLIRFLDRMACHHALDETGGGSAKKTPPSAWTEQLAEAEYRILFAEGTEPPGQQPTQPRDTSRHIHLRRLFSATLRKQDKVYERNRLAKFLAAYS